MAQPPTANAFSSPVNTQALRSEIREALINHKAIACPMAIRLAWHAAGTYDAKAGDGGSDGALMRFPPESTDPANAGLSIIQDLLLKVKKRHPEISFADLWAYAGALSVEFMGGPRVPFSFGRSDAPAGTQRGPVENGRLPDAAQGAAHLREVFHRMGMSDRDIVALSGAHTLGRCHQTRSGFDGKWTHDTLAFNNGYFVNLLHEEWVPRKWDGPLQYQDKRSGELMMLPSDIALLSDPVFRPIVELYAMDEGAFFADFADAFGRLIAQGTPATPPAKAGGCPFAALAAKGMPPPPSHAKASAELREHAMHGSLELVQKYAAQGGDVHSREASSGRTALHKAAFWGHDHICEWLVRKGVDVSVKDFYGDTAVHDAAKFGHDGCVRQMLVSRAKGARAAARATNDDGLDAAAVADAHGKASAAAIIRAAASRSKL